MKSVYITVAGTMGVGKTTAAQLLAERLPNACVLQEQEAVNTFLPDFYEDKQRWAFTSQTFFLLAKLKQSLQTPALLKKGKTVIQDTPIQQDVFSYAKAQLELGNMSAEEFKLYMDIFHFHHEALVKPDLWIYLDADIPTLMARVDNRNRAYEDTVEQEYIELLDTLNKEWLKTIPKKKLLRIKSQGYNLVDDKADQNEFLELIKGKMQV